MIGDDVMTSSEKEGAQKTAIVTGASQGIGAGLVKRFLALGYNVVANSRHVTKSGLFEASDKLALVMETSAKLRRRRGSPRRPKANSDRSMRS